MSYQVFRREIGPIVDTSQVPPVIIDCHPFLQHYEYMAYE